MKSSKIIISSLLFLTISLFLCVLYKRTHFANETLGLIPVTIPRPGNVATTSKISNGILDDIRHYKDLNEYEKSLITGFVLKHTEILPYDSDLKDELLLAYYNESIALIGMSSGREGSSLYHNIYDIHTWKLIQGQEIQGKNIYGKKYIISYDGKEALGFYKIGNREFKKVIVPKLHKDEFYVAGYGMGGDGYDLSFDENTKTMTMGVYGPIPTNSETATKIREVKVMLPE